MRCALRVLCSIDRHSYTAFVRLLSFTHLTVMGERRVIEGDLLWVPSARRQSRANITRYMSWLAERGRAFHSYDDLWRWSVEDQGGFWGSLFEYFGVRTSNPHVQALGAICMPGADWFPGARGGRI